MNKATIGTTPNREKRTTLVVRRTPEESDSSALARTLMDVDTRHGFTAAYFVEKLLGTSDEKPALDDYIEFVKGGGANAAKGELAMASRMLSAQAISLDAMFTEFARRAANNMGDYFDASERYARLAMKAQSNCRATVESLAKLHQPREQTVRHVHVNEGGQAIVTDEFHHHGGAAKSGVSKEQSHAPKNDGSSDRSAALPGPDPERDGVPIAGSQGQAALQNARRG